jgi:hypothetical protein
MKKAENGSRDSLSWAGSQKGSKKSFEGLLRGETGQDIYKLHEIRHKLEDSKYVDSAVTRIAHFLSNKLEKKDDHER